MTISDFLISDTITICQEQPNKRKIPVFLHTLDESESLKVHAEILENYGKLLPKKLYQLTSPDGPSLHIFYAYHTLNGIVKKKPSPEYISLNLGAELCKALPVLTGTRKETHYYSIFVSTKIKLLAQNSLENFIIGLVSRTVSLKVAKNKKNLVNQNENDINTDSKTELYFENLSTEPSVFQKAGALLEGMKITRSLINMPANILDPNSFEDFVKRQMDSAAKSLEGKAKIRVNVLNSDELSEKGCGLIHAVGKAATHKARVVHIQYRPEQLLTAQSAPIALIGKGITFDTGGLDMKASNFMRNMKKDMGGSAAVFGAFYALIQRDLGCNLDCWLAIAENSVGTGAMRPGDVYTAHNGITVEIDNTDAEGRLVLGDTLSLATQSNPRCLIDVATLTGAARTSLGPWVDSLFSNDENLATLFKETAETTGDFVWQMPLVADYANLLDSAIADCSNCSQGSHAGAITAALFLEKFVSDVPWVHIDSYMWSDKPTDLYAESGATAKCVRLIVNSVEKLATRR